MPYPDPPNHRRIIVGRSPRWVTNTIAGSTTHRQVPDFSPSWPLLSPELVAHFSCDTQASITSVAARVPEVEFCVAQVSVRQKISETPPFRPEGVAQSAIGHSGMGGIAFCAPEAPS